MIGSTTVVGTARPYLPNAHGVEHGEAAESIARSVGLAGTWWSTTASASFSVWLARRGRRKLLGASTGATLARGEHTERAKPLKSMPFGVRLKLRRNCLKWQVCVHHACMTTGSVAILRSRRRHASERVERAARVRGPSARLACRAGESAAPLRAASAETRWRAVRPYGPRPHGSHRRQSGRHR